MDNELNWRHYAEIHRKFMDNGLIVLAHQLKMRTGLTDQEIRAAVGPSYWGVPDDKVDEQRAWVVSMCQAPPPPGAALPPPPPYRMHYAEICRRLVEDRFPVEAVYVKRIFRLTNQEICDATVGPHFWAEADGSVTWSDSLVSDSSSAVNLISIYVRVRGG